MHKVASLGVCVHGFSTGLAQGLQVEVSQNSSYLHTGV